MKLWEEHERAFRGQGLKKPLPSARSANDLCRPRMIDRTRADST